MESLSAYLPEDRRAALRSGVALPDRSAGAVLLADISGFTPLTEALAAALGPRQGAEELTLRLNAVYDALIAEVRRAGGSVISFAGDAITCWFDDTPLDHEALSLEIGGAVRHSAARALRSAAHSAAACALAMQRAMRRAGAIVLPDRRALALVLKVAIASGPVRRFVVGDPRIQLIDTLAGRTLERMAAAEQLAAGGEIVVDARTAELLADEVGVRAWRVDQASGERFAALDEPAALADNPDAQIAGSPETPALADAEARAWLLPAIYERLSAGMGEFLTELRPAAALFVRFGGFEYDAHGDVGQRFDAYIRHVQRVVARYEGALLQISIGEKGSYFYAAFGAPISHEDDARRAVAAAVELRAPPPGLGEIPPPQIGVSRGIMRVGAYGGALRRTYGVLGEEVNIAARLMSRAAPGQILVSPQVAGATRAAFAYDQLGALQLKGLGRPLPVFAVREQRPDDAALPAPAGGPLLGREAELSMLRELLDALADGLGGAALIEGEAGIGKSRLAAELLDEARRRGVATLIASGDAIRRATPYHAWQPALRRLFGLDETMAEAAAGARVLAELTEIGMAERAPLLNAVLPLGLPENELTAQLSDGLRALNTRSLLLELLRRATEGAPTLLLVEDAHWLDSASLGLLEQVRAQLPGLLLVTLARPMPDAPAGPDEPGGPAPDTYERLRATPGARIIELASLPREALHALVCQRLGVDAVPQPVLSLIDRTAEGHPLFSEEIAYALRDAGVIQVEGGACRLMVPAGGLRDISIPDTIQGIITSRLDRLSPAQQLTVKVASVIGRVFLYRGLHDIHPSAADRERLGEHLEALARLEITPVQSPEPELAYLFRHSVTREAAYQLLLYSQRRRLHQRVAEWYESAYAGNLEPHYGLLAYHWAQAAGSPPDDQHSAERAVLFLERAGGQALRASAHREAADLFRQAIALDERRPRAAGDALDGAASIARRARWMSQVCQAYSGWGHFAEAQRWIERAAALYGQPMPTGRAALGRALGRAALRQTAHRLAPGLFLGRASAAERPALCDLARCHQLIGEMAFFGNQKEASLYAVVRMLNLSESAGRSVELAQAYAIMSVVSGAFGAHGLAETYSRRAAETARALGHAPTLADVLRIDALYRLGRAEWARAEDNLRQAIPVHERLGDRRSLGDSRTLLAQVALYTGRYQEGMAISREVLQIARQHESPTQQIWCHAQHALYALRAGRPADAIAPIETALPLIEEHARGTADIYCLGLLAHAHWLLGDHQRARGLAGRVDALIIASGGRPSDYSAIQGYVAAAEVFLGLWEQGGPQPEVRAAARRACRALRSYQTIFPMGAASALLYQGRLAWLGGRRGRAIASWRASLAAAERAGLPYEQGQAHYALGRNLARDTPAREQHLARAGAIFERLGAVRDAELARDSHRSIL